MSRNKVRQLCGDAAAWGVVGVMSLTLAMGCEDESLAVIEGPAPAAGGAAKSAATAVAPVAAVGATAATTSEPMEPVVYSDEDFVESEHNRDPFRPHMLVAKPGQVPELSQRRVVMAETPIESMRLIAIITGTERPRAMLVDPTDVGHVVERGMYVGRAQVVQASANVAMTLNWRVDRIRENEVVLTRDDPTDPSRPPLIHVIPLHEEVAQN